MSETIDERMDRLRKQVWEVRNAIVGVRLDLAKVVDESYETLGFNSPDDIESQEVLELLDSIDILAHPNVHGGVLATEVANCLMYIEMLLEESYVMEA